MPDYQQGKIYAIRNTLNDKVYIGSTTDTLARRFWGHKLKSKRTSPQLSKAVEEHPDGWGGFYIELLYKYPCSCREELNAEEGRAMRENNSKHNGYNTKIAGRTQNELKTEEPERWAERKERERQQRETKKDNKSAYDKEYNANNRSKRKEYGQKKITCECGMVICQFSKHRHIRSKQHNDLLKLQ